MEAPRCACGSAALTASGLAWRPEHRALQWHTAFVSPVLSRFLFLVSAMKIFFCSSAEGEPEPEGDHFIGSQSFSVRSVRSHPLSLRLLEPTTAMAYGHVVSCYVLTVFFVLL